MIKVGIVGATGYAGQQLLWILLQHKRVTIEFIASQTYHGKKFSEIYPNYHTIFSNILIPFDDVKTALKNIDVLFIALPHGMSEELAQAAIQNNTKVIDLGADFRLDHQDIYQHWYHTEFKHPLLHQNAVYGLPEIHKEAIKHATIIASPGCFPTSAILGAAPLLKNGLLDKQQVIVDAKSGVSGAGRNVRISNLYVEVNENIKAYNVLRHRHTPEMKQEMDKLAQSAIHVIFTPHLVPMNRGILSTLYFDIKKTQQKTITEDMLFELYHTFYQDCPFVRVVRSLPEISHVKNSNFCDISLRYDPEFGSLVVVSAIDNIIKGAGGQAVQSMNLLCNFDETEGLQFFSTYI